MDCRRRSEVQDFDHLAMAPLAVRAVDGNESVLNGSK